MTTEEELDEDATAKLPGDRPNGINPDGLSPRNLWICTPWSAPTPTPPAAAAAMGDRREGRNPRGNLVLSCSSRADQSEWEELKSEDWETKHIFPFWRSKRWWTLKKVMNARYIHPMFPYLMCYVWIYFSENSALEWVMVGDNSMWAAEPKFIEPGWICWCYSYIFKIGKQSRARVSR